MPLIGLVPVAVLVLAPVVVPVLVVAPVAVLEPVEDQVEDIELELVEENGLVLQQDEQKERD